MTRVGISLAALLALTTTAAAQEREGKTYVLVVGINDYADAKVTDLKFAEADARAVYDFYANDAASPTSAERVKLLIGAQATQRGVLRALQSHLVRQAVRPEDTAILYFAGHGFLDAAGDAYLACHDTEADGLAYSSISAMQLQTLWNRIGARQRILIADACHSGALADIRPFGGVGKRVLPKPRANDTRRSLVIAAASNNQFSVEDKQAKHGVFTATLLAALRGRADENRNKVVTAAELRNYLEREVPIRARTQGGVQNPVVTLHGGVAGLGMSRPGAGPRPLSKSEARAKLEAEKRAIAEAERRVEAERRAKAELAAVKAKAEAAELRQKVAELEGKKAAAEKARLEAKAARQRERELAASSKSGSTSDSLPVPYQAGDYLSAVERAKALSDFRYVQTRRFTCGSISHEVACFRHTKTGLYFRLVPGGSYLREDKKTVTVRPFLLCATECTQEAWKAVMRSSIHDLQRKHKPRYVSLELSGLGPKQPMYLVDWATAKEFCRRSGLRLPSESEWEYACRSGSRGPYAGGDRDAALLRLGWFLRNSGHRLLPAGTKRDFKKIRGEWGCGTHVVAEKLPNAYGLFDMHGNVWEWCEDAFTDNYQGAPSDGSACTNGTRANCRTIRGGSWRDPATACRSSVRDGVPPSVLGGHLGFRPARSRD